MTIYYCDELVDDDGEYIPMKNGPAEIISFDIGEDVKCYEFMTRGLPNLEVDIEFILPTVMEMLSVKDGFSGKLDRFISTLMLTALDSSEPSYYEDLRLLATEEIRFWKPQENNVERDLLSIDVLSGALEYLGNSIYGKIADVAYQHKYLAFNLYSYHNGFVTMVINYVPLLDPRKDKPTIPNAKTVELSINTVLSRYGKAIEFQ